jgi:hypothetical protein
LGCFFESADDTVFYHVYSLIPAPPICDPSQLDGLCILALDKRAIEKVSKSRAKKGIYVIDIKAVAKAFIFVPEGISDVFYHVVLCDYGKHFKFRRSRATYTFTDIG